MILNSDLPMIRDLLARQKKTIRIWSDGSSIPGVSFEEIVKIALAMHEHSYFFLVRRNINVIFVRDVNGGGTQCLSVEIKNDSFKSHPIFSVFFKPVYGNDCEYHYEADLFTDQSRDYEPTINRGKHKFVAEVAELNIEWNTEIVHKWEKDIKRLSFLPDSLCEWIEKDLDMVVFCRLPYFCRAPKIILISDLKKYAAKGITLEDLKARFTCSKCGQRGAHIQVF